MAYAVDFFLVGGGAGGGSGSGRNGGGGGGRILTGTDSLAAGAYPVVIGAGGATDTNGGDSTFNGHTALGGGRGANASNSAGNGGSGGGGSDAHIFAGTADNSDGGIGSDAGDGEGTFGGGGGGGATQPGVRSIDSPNGGSGGDGLHSSFSGTAVWYAGGGKGNSTRTPVSGQGSGSGSYGGGGDYSAAGGPGLLILRAPLGTVNASGGTHSSDSTYDYWTFTSGATFTLHELFSASLSVSMMNSASRLATVGRAGVFARTLADSIMNAALRFVLLNKKSIRWGFFTWS